MDRTGRALGTLEPIVYFENRAGDIVLPPVTKEGEARWVYEYAKDANGRTFRDKGYDWREASTLAEVDRLQDRLVEAERRKAENELERDERLLAGKRTDVRSRLYQRLVSSSTSPYEREFIELYLQMREEKRKEIRQRWLERQAYLWAREMDANTKPTDRMKSEPGDQWRANEKA